MGRNSSTGCTSLRIVAPTNVLPDDQLLENCAKVLPRRRRSRRMPIAISNPGPGPYWKRLFMEFCKHSQRGVGRLTTALHERRQRFAVIGERAANRHDLPIERAPDPVRRWVPTFVRPHMIGYVCVARESPKPGYPPQIEQP